MYLTAAVDFKLAFEDVERFILTMVDVFWCSVMRRHGTLGQGVPPIDVFTECLRETLNKLVSSR